jgi:hypothetical protein
MYIGPRDETACKQELETVEDYCSRIFTTEIDLIAFRAQLREIILDRISDYVFQRYRDWPVADLLRMESVVEKAAVARAGLDQPKEFRGGKRDRKEKA